MNGRARLGVLAATVSLLVAGCAKGEKSETRATLVGPLAVELRWERHVGSGRSEWNPEVSKLYVKSGGATLEIEGRCSAPKPQLAGDGTTARFAYRCAPTETWSPVYVASAHLFASNSTKLGAGDQPAWAAAPRDFAAAAPDALQAILVSWNEHAYQNLFAEVTRLPEGDRTAFLRATIGVPRSSLEWQHLTATLSPAGRTKLVTMIAPELAKPIVDHASFCNTVEFVDPGDPVLRANALPRLEELASVAAERPCWRGTDKLLGVAIAIDVARAGRVACQFAGKSDFLEQVGEWPSPRPHTALAIAALAKAKTKCSAVDAVVKKNACSHGLFGDGKPVTPADAKAALDAIGKQPAVDSHEASNQTMRALLGLAYALGAAPGSFSCAK